MALVISIEDAQPADLEEILRVQRLAFQSQAELYGAPCLPPMTETVADLESDLSRDVFLKAVADGRIVGSVRGRMKGDCCHVARLSVHPEFQNSGLGARLMHELEGRFVRARRFELFTGARSANTLHLYEKLGYEIRRREVADDGIELVHLEKTIGR